MVLRQIISYQFIKLSMTRSLSRWLRSLFAHACQDVHGRVLLDKRILDPRFREDDGEMKSGNYEKEET
jgi:hypothetical protein